MCGHVGIAGALSYKDEALMRRLLMFDYFRGTDSTGLAAVFEDDDIRLAKVASHPINLFDTTRFKSALNGFKSKAFIGHNRAATKGVVNEVNAHPYHHGHIVGAHNGTLTQSSWDKLQEIAGEKTGTDSDAIFAAIAKVGIDEVVPHLQGAWALVWFDLKDNTLNFLRNKERPFWYCYTKDFKKVIWASEFWMLRASNQASPEKDRDDLYIDDKNFSFYSTQEDWHYRYDLDDLKKGSDGRPKPRVKTLKGKEPAPVTTYGGASNFPRLGHQASGGTTGSATSTTQSSTSSTTHSRGNAPRTPATPGFMRLDATDAHPFGDYLSDTYLDSVAKYGCSWCQGDVDFGEEGSVIFEKEDTCLCHKCSPHAVNRVYADPAHLDEFKAAADVIGISVAA